MTLRLLSIDPAEELRSVRAERMRRDFALFAREAWEHADPAPLTWGWHLDAICLHLQAVAEGRIQRLLINVPPGHAKSMFVAVLWPVWRWLRNPAWRLLSASYDMKLSTRDALKARTLIKSEWFQQTFRPGWSLSGDQDAKMLYFNSALGFRQCLSVGSGATGHRGDALIIDDPLSALGALSELKRQGAIDWKTQTMSSRFNSQALAEEVLIMQRLHEDDLSGYLLRAGGWTHLCLPSEYDPDRHCVTYARPPRPPEVRTADEVTQWRMDTPEEVLWEDPRTERGELLFPALFSREVLDEAKSPKGMGAMAYAGQHEQNPVPASGGIIQRRWLHRFWCAPGVSRSLREKPFEGAVWTDYDPRATRDLPGERLIVTDATFKKATDSDLVCVMVVDVRFPDLYVVDWEWERMGFVDTAAAIMRMRKRWSIPQGAQVRRVGIEDKANGPALIDVLKQKIPGIIGIEPIGSKEARVSAASAYLQSGNVYLPDAHPQLVDAINQAASFPKGSHDDWIDALAHAILLTLGTSSAGWLEKLTRWN